MEKALENDDDPEGFLFRLGEGCRAVAADAAQKRKKIPQRLRPWKAEVYEGIMEAVRREPETEAFLKHIAGLGLNVNDLVSVSPGNWKHRDRARKVAMHVAGDRNHSFSLEKGGGLAVDSLAETLGFTPEFIKSYRVYITALAVLQSGLYPQLEDFLASPWELSGAVPVFKGVVLQKKRDGALVLTNEGEFRILTGLAHDPGDEVKRRENRNLLIYACGTAALFLLTVFLVTAISPFVFLQMGDGAVIELGVNRWNRVVAASEVGSRGGTAPGFRGLTVEKAVARWVESCPPEERNSKLAVVIVPAGVSVEKARQKVIAAFHEEGLEGVYLAEATGEQRRQAMKEGKPLLDYLGIRQSVTPPENQPKLPGSLPGYEANCGGG